MNPGRELDALVGEIMGQRWVADCPLGDSSCPGKYEPQIGGWPCLPPYSTQIEAGIWALDWLEKNHTWEGVPSLMLSDGRPSVCVVKSLVISQQNTSSVSKVSEGKTYAHAICLALLATKGER